jgi:hypothetical protein
MEKGKEGQQEKMDIIRSKIIYFSLGIEELIQSAVSNYVKVNKPILLTNMNDPFLENACCDEKSINTYSYFVDKEPSIDVYNRRIDVLNSYLLDAHRKSSAMTLFEPSDTRTLSITLNQSFSPDTMYKALIHYCSSISNLNELNELNEICENKKDISKNMNQIIKMMKEKSDVYDKNMFEKMMIQINNQNLIHINNANDNIDIEVNKALQEIKDRFMSKENIASASASASESFANYLNTFIGLLEKIIKSDSDIDDMSDYLNTENTRLLNKITSFVIKNSKDNKTSKETIDCIKQLLIFKESRKELKEKSMFESVNEDREKMYKMETFFKNAAESIIVVLPNMILNKVTYQKNKEDNETDNETLAEDDVYKRWGLATTHKNDLKKILYEKYKSLITLNNKSENIKLILSKCEKSNNDIHFLIKRTIYTHMKDKTKIGINNIDVIRMIYKFYLLNIISNIINVESNVERKIRKYTFDNDFDEKNEELVMNKNGIIEKSPLKYKIKNNKNKKKNKEDKDEDEDKKVNDENQEEDKYLYKNANITQDICLVITTFMKILCENKKKVNYNYESLMNGIIKYKNSEKNSITKVLDDMDDEERKVDKEMRANKLGKWSKGSGRIYTKERYDEERDEIILKSKNVSEDMLYEEEEMYVNQQIEDEELGMENIGEDNDNYGEDQEREYGEYE